MNYVLEEEALQFRPLERAAQQSRRAATDMKGRDAAIRRILIRLKDYFAKRGWEDAKASSATTLVMKATPNPGVAHRLVVDEPLAASLLPSTNVLGLGCSVSVYFEQLENIFNSIFGYDPDTYGRVSASVALCQVMPKGACHLGVHLVKPESETPISGLTADYERYLEPLIAQLST